jgi:hypothetical protein
LELQALGDDALRLWGDAQARASALTAIVTAWEASDRTALRTAVARVDRAVAEGLAALRLPRGPIRAVRVEGAGRGWLGRKTRACDILLDGDGLASAIRARRRPDEVFRTWIHESLHGRLPYALPAVELRRTRGYEEGMVEGLARLATRDKAAMRTLDSSYPYYVTAYRALAAVSGVEVETLWRALWVHPMGEVRSAFVGAVDYLRSRATGRPLRQAQRLRLQGLADRMFDSVRSGAAEPSQSVVERTWGMVFR